MKNTLFAAVTAFLLAGCTATRTAQTVATTATDTALHSAIEEKYWKLVILEGYPTKLVRNQEKEVYLMLKGEDRRLHGFSGCNAMKGSYVLAPGNGIRFFDIVSTLRACPNVTFDESGYLQLFELVTRYTLSNDTLRLSSKTRDDLAVFKATGLQ